MALFLQEAESFESEEAHMAALPRLFGARCKSERLDARSEGGGGNELSTAELRRWVDAMARLEREGHSTSEKRT